eukprot:745650-Hanusia_phi.AAC.2
MERGLSVVSARPMALTCQGGACDEWPRGHSERGEECRCGETGGRRGRAENNEVQEAKREAKKRGGGAKDEVKSSSDSVGQTKRMKGSQLAAT